MGFDYWAAYVSGEKSKQTDLKDTPVSMTLPINDLHAVSDYKKRWSEWALEFLKKYQFLETDRFLILQVWALVVS